MTRKSRGFIDSAAPIANTLLSAPLDEGMQNQWVYIKAVLPLGSLPLLSVRLLLEVQLGHRQVASAMP
jgi:hypothetical protein